MGPTKKHAKNLKLTMKLLRKDRNFDPTNFSEICNHPFKLASPGP